jgi:PAS domain-containing protein
MVGTKEPWRGFYATARPVLANIIMDDGGEGALAPLYPDGHWRSPLIDGAVEAEIYFTHMGESGRWLHCIAAPLRDSRGRLIGAVETLQDVTDRRLARPALCWP